MVKYYLWAKSGEKPNKLNFRSNWKQRCNFNKTLQLNSTSKARGDEFKWDNRIKESWNQQNKSTNIHAKNVVYIKYEWVNPTIVKKDFFFVTKYLILKSHNRRFIIWE